MQPKWEYTYDGQTADYGFSLRRQQYNEIIENIPERDFETFLIGQDEFGNDIYDNKPIVTMRENVRREYIGNPERLAVCPGDWEAVEDFAPELLPIFETIWTEEIVDAWTQKCEANKPVYVEPSEPQPDPIEFVRGMMEVLADD